MVAHFVSMYSSAEIPFSGHGCDAELFNYGQGDPIPGTGRVATAADCGARSAEEVSRWGHGGDGALFKMELQMTVLDACEHMIEVPEIRKAVLDAWTRRVRVEVRVAERPAVARAGFPWRLALGLDLDLWHLGDHQPVLGRILQHRLYWPCPISKGQRIGARIAVGATAGPPPVNADARIHARLVLDGVEGRFSG